MNSSEYFDLICKDLTVSELRQVSEVVVQLKANRPKKHIPQKKLEEIIKKELPADKFEPVSDKEQKEINTALGLEPKVLTLPKDDEVNIFGDVDIENDVDYEPVEFETHTGNDEEENEDEENEEGDDENPTAEETGGEQDENEDDGGEVKKRLRLTSLGRQKFEELKKVQVIEGKRRRNKDEIAFLDRAKDRLLMLDYETVDELIQDEIDKGKRNLSASGIEPLAATI